MSPNDQDKLKSNTAVSLAAIMDLNRTANNTAADHAGTQVQRDRSNNRTAKRRTVRLLNHLRTLEMLVPNSNISPDIKNEYRRIKRPLLSNAFGKSASLVDKGNLIVVTSSVPGEGKTYTAVNLALAFAQECDSTVLLIDCDVTKHGVSRLLGVEKCRPDITDLLASDVLSVGDALLHTDVPSLVVLPAGRSHEYITELVASQRMERLVNEIATRYTDRIVIFDAPPLLSTPEAQVITGLVGQVVFVIEAGKTPRSVVEDALEMVPKEKAIGLVLNKSESISNRGTYYYNYYTSYGEKPE
jgi:exopolysaccharide/PEP-CTERM locus tyrosine autokinase